MVAAIDAAQVALERGLVAHERAAILQRTAVALVEREAQFAELICAEAGKPISAARLEAQRAVGTFEAAAVAARVLGGELVPMDAWPGGAGKLGFTMRRPIGVIGAITPFNFPLNLVAHKVAPAIAAGCPVVLKPSERTPMSALLLAEVLEASGLPSDWLSVVLAPPAETARLFCEDDRVAMISFTGSASIGRQLREQAPHKKVVLELGNATPVIVEPGADLEAAATKCAATGFAYAGQACVSVQRVFVHETLYDDFLDRFAAKVDALVVGDPADEATFVGPVIDAGSRDRIRSWIAAAVDAGARVVAGGELEGEVLRPTVLTGTTRDMDLASSEVFGPVVVVERHASLAEAIDRANDTPYGLQAGIFTGDVTAALKAAPRLRFGSVLVNETPSFRADHMPYGGIKESGNGTEGPLYAAREMTNEQLIVLQVGD